MRRPTDCQGCAFAGESSQGGDHVFCFRHHRNIPARSHCDSVLPLKTTSQRIRRRSARKERHGTV